MPVILWVLLLAPLAVLLGLFGLSNRGEVVLRLWPLDLAMAAPLSLTVLTVAAVSFLFGAGIAWVAGLAPRRRGRRMEDAARLLEAELTQLRARAAVPTVLPARTTGAGPVPSRMAPALPMLPRAAS